MAESDLDTSLTFSVSSRYGDFFCVANIYSFSLWRLGLPSTELKPVVVSVM